MNIAIRAITTIFILGVYIQRRRLKRFGNPQLLRELMPNVSYIRPHIKFYMLIVALSLLIFALARPQIGSKLEKKKTTGIEVMMVLDVSNSMLATDVAPSRLENAKMMLSKLIDQMEKTKLQVREYKKRNEEFFPYLLAALLLLITEILIRNTLLRRLP